MQRLKGRRALVTGAGQGIGKAIALAFAREGASVAVADIKAESVRNTAKEIVALGQSATAFEADIGLRVDSQPTVLESASALGGIDILVNSAAWAKVGVPIAETDDELYQRTLDVCMSSVFGPCERPIRSSSKVVTAR